MHFTRFVLLPTTGLVGSAWATISLPFRRTLNALCADLSDGLLGFTYRTGVQVTRYGVLLEARSGLDDNTRCTALDLLDLEEVILGADRLWPIVQEVLQVGERYYDNRKIVQGALYRRLLDYGVSHGATDLMN